MHSELKKLKFSPALKGTHYLEVAIQNVKENRYIFEDLQEPYHILERSMRYAIRNAYMYDTKNFLQNYKGRLKEGKIPTLTEFIYTLAEE